jgi:hypothetical protein
MKGKADPALLSGDFRTIHPGPKNSRRDLRYVAASPVSCGGNGRRMIMRFPGSVFIASLFTLGILCHGIVLVQLSHHPERGHRAPAEASRTGQAADSESDAFRWTAAGLELGDPRAW